MKNITLQREYNTDNLIRYAADLGVELSEIQIKQFLKYYEMLIEKNEVMNLTAITDYDEVILKHFIDSIAIVQIKDMHQNISVIDLGTGAGFPGLPLKIAFPEIEITLMDSLNKRINFLDEVIQELGLTGISTVHDRAELGARNKSYRGQFDLCVSRAVANISTLSEYCIPFVKIGGQFISYKSGQIDDEISGKEDAIKLLGGKLNTIYRFDLADTDQSRSFVVIDKVKETPKKFPRKAGTPSKEPL